jgi:fatty acid desaturase
MMGEKALESNSISPGSIPKALLRGARPQRLLLYALADWTVIVAVWNLAARAPLWLYPLWVLLLVGRLHALGVVLHDAVHLPLPRKSAGVRLIVLLAGYPVATTLEAMRYHHLRHHRDVGLPGDPYLKPWVGRSAVRRWLLSFRYFLLTPLWVLRCLYGAIAFYIPALRNSYGRWFLQDRSGSDLTNQAEVINCAREEHWQLLFFVCVGALAALWPRWMLEYYFVPLVLTGYLAGYRLLHEHVQEPAHDRSVETVERSTRNHHLGLLGHLILAPHNVGYHLVHHLHPQAALENLPGLEQWHRQNRPTCVG